MAKNLGSPKAMRRMIAYLYNSIDRRSHGTGLNDDKILRHYLDDRLYNL